MLKKWSSTKLIGGGGAKIVLKDGPNYQKRFDVRCGGGGDLKK